MNIIWYCIVLGLFSFALALWTGAARRSRCTSVALLVCAAMFQALGFINATVHTLPGAGVDAQSFLQRAMELAVEPWSAHGLAIGAVAYVELLALFGALTRPEPVVLQYASILPACLALTLIVRINSRIETDLSSNCVVAILALLSPSFLLYSSVALRESVELVSIAAYLACVVARPQAKRAVLCAPLLAPAMAVHPALFVYAFGLIAGVCVVAAVDRDRPNESVGFSYLLLGGAAAGLVAVTFLVPLWYGLTLAELMQQGFTTILAEYRRPIEEADAATAFGFEPSLATTPEAAWSLAINYCYYLFGPLVDFRPDYDYLAMAWEALVRVAGLAAAGLLLYRRLATTPMLILLGYYFTMTMTWSLATTNNGQAFRHHMLTQWVMFIFIGSTVALLSRRGRRR